MEKKLLVIFFMFLNIILAGKSIDKIKIEIKETGEKAVVMDTMAIKVEINGDIAVTTYDMTFYNPNNRILEGEFSFPLQENQKVTRYALDVNGKLREGVAVEKEKARVAYENTIRQRIDPGIIEKTAGNTYKTRIYPIPANGYKRVVIAYTEILKNKENNLDYFLPLNYDQKVKNFSLEIKMIKQEKKPSWIEKIDNLEFDKIESGYFAGISKQDYTPDKNIRISFPSDNSDKVYTEKTNEAVYFSSKINLENNFYREKKKSQNIILIWDTSSSAVKRDIDKELELLEKYFSYLENAKVSLYTIDNEFSDKGEFQVRSGNWSSLKNTIKSFVYDGGTQFKKININKNADEIIFVSDGINTIDSSEIKISKIPFIFITSSKESDTGYMKNLANLSWGKVIDLNREDVDTELDKMKHDYLNLVSYKYNKNEVEEVYPVAESDIRNSFDFAGIIKTNQAEITVNLGFGDIITETRKILINTNTDSKDIDKLWAEKKIENLSGNYEKNKNEIIKTAKDHSLVTKETSLIVLDRIEDYVRYEIIPPEELLTEYNNQMRIKKANTENEKKSGLEESVEVLKQRVADYTRRETIRPNEGNIDYDLIVPSPAAAPMVVQKSSSVKNKSIALEGAYSSTAQTENFKKESAPINGKKLDTVIYESKDRNSEYMNEYKKLKSEDIYKKYLEMKEKYGENPFFYVDTADYLMKNNQKSLAVKVLTNIPELSSENHEYYRIFGYKLLEAGNNDLAVKIFEKVLDLKGEDLQSIRDLAIAYINNGEEQKALDTMYKILLKPTPSEWALKGIVINEMNNLIEKNKSSLNIKSVDKRLIYPMPVDYRVVLDWSKDNQEIDLWLTQPDGTKIYYGAPITADNNGIVYNHTTFRYGPEELIIKKAKNGEYNIQVEYYANQSQTLKEPVIIRLEIITNYGRKNEKRQIIVRRVENVKEFLEIGKFLYNGR